MNGRVFDTNIGRFIQADIMNDSGLQGLNPYSYVLNNPFSLTDPSGYLSFGDVLRIAAVAIISFYTGGTALGLLQGGQILSGLAVAGLGGFATGYIMTGSVKGGIRGAWSAMATAAIGGIVDSSAFASAFGDISQAAAVVAQGLTSGIVAELQGGNFGSAFAAAGLGAASGMLNAGDPSIGGAIIAAIAGGTISELTGGDFANGAVSAAMSYAVMAANQYSPIEPVVTGSNTKSQTKAKYKDYEKLTIDSAKIVEKITMKANDDLISLEDFLIDIHNRIQSLSSQTGYEYRAAIGKKTVNSEVHGERLLYSAVIETSSSPFLSASTSIVNGYTHVPSADIHNHGIMKRGYKIKKMDALYLNSRQNKFIVREGKVRSNKDFRSIQSMIDLNKASRQDLNSPHGGRLSTPTKGLIKY